ncbi:FAD-linked oxidase C-terminal domain-containing protein [Nocardiopsis sp. N85]|uniref:FAD-binding oxidoreductase n=1 Tax=Nocardiopsis sp. N85 TaxID=3029400 RepID=UPI00237FC6AB|nr:FAD-linked oxidase C-terminal domain-containing protein [Nocardiopsis sp. N85]MDE3722775.1 FAD-linked oxidase C-terminal domain-containing protein [Nocardiopsis sp. N85]
MSIAERLVAAIGADQVVTDPEIMEGYAHDEAEWAPHGRPEAVVRPRDTADVAAVVSLCAEHGVPLVGRGAGTGLSGAANAVDGWVVVSFERMDRVLRVDPVQQSAVVQPGVVNDDLRRRVAEDGLWYPPDPASAPWSTIGGNVATNAGGLCCVKYGVTRDYVLGMEAVVGRGRVVRLGRSTAKGVTGYDLAGLMVGSEGTLGLITEVTLRMRPLRSGVEHTVIGYFDSLTDAGRAVAAVAASGVIPSALELIDRFCLQAVDEWKNMGLSAEGEVLLLARSDQPGAAGEQEADAILACFEAEGAGYAVRSTDAEEAEALFAARRLAYPALERLGPLLTEDVCVPKALVPHMLERIEETGRRLRVHIANIAHAGDGNLHPLFIVPAGDEEAKKRAKEAFEVIVDEALALGGTVTGEHGVGLLKRGGAARELGPDVLDMHRAVKNALDPAGVFNPGKVFG